MSCTYTPQQVESDPAIKGMNLTRMQLINYLLDIMIKGNEEERKEAKEKLFAICPKRK